MSAELDALTAQIASNTTVIGSALVLIRGIRDRIDQAITGADAATRAKLTELRNDLSTTDQELADAVAANTPPTPTT